MVSLWSLKRNNGGHDLQRPLQAGLELCKWVRQVGDARAAKMGMVYAVVALFYLKYSLQLFGNNKNYFIIYEFMYFLCLKCWKKKL